MLPPQTPGSVEPIRDITPWFKCPSCGDTFSLRSDFFDRGRTIVVIKCPACGIEIAPWHFVRGMFNEPWPDAVFAALGARSQQFTTKLFVNSETRFDLYAEGLPKDAVILEINFMADGMFCTEMGGNLRRQRPRGGRLQLYGFHTYTLAESGKTEGIARLSVTWVHSSPEDVAWRNLVDAFDAFADRDFEDAVIPANVAVETKLYPLIEREFKEVTTQDRLRSFLETGATYSHQLNVLLPFITRCFGLPALDRTVQRYLNELRKARNDIAHRGHLVPAITKDRAADFLTAAVLGFRYIDALSLRRQQMSQGA
jgi:predicted RNA-binding Zn-ribbon protein involved in translation (DUF1610 family)